MIFQIIGASDGDAEINIDFEKFENLISNNPSCKVTLGYGESPDSLQPNQRVETGDGKYYHYLITEV